MSNFQNISIVLTFLALWMSNFFDTRTELMVGFVLIFTIGIVHGANDVQIIKKVQSKRRPFLRLVVYYVLTVLAVALLFFVLPKLALLVFILLSAYHFGEQHFNTLKNSSRILKMVFFISYGLTVLFLLFYTHVTASREVIAEITNVQIDKSIFVMLLISSMILLASCGVLLIIQGHLKSWYKELFYILVMFIIFKSTSLIWGFAVYFVFWHSLPSILDQVRFLNGDVTKKGMLMYLKSSLLYWVLALIGLFVFYYIFKDQDQLFLPLFFTFLAAITFPHVLVMHKLFDH